MVSTEVLILRLNTLQGNAQVQGDGTHDIDATHIELVRQELATHPPFQVLSLFFAQKWTGSRPAAIQALRHRLQSRQAILKWVYGESRAREACYAHLPSRSKRLFVSELVARVRTRFGWISPRLVHAFAFRPDCFDAEPTKLRRTGRKWRALYETRIIPKTGKTHRVLHIPSPPLRRIQRCLLQLCLERAMGSLPQFVNGCRPRLSAMDPTYGVYRNAESHLGQAFVVNCDLKDFFPSVRIGQVIRTLQSLPTPLHFVPNGSGDSLESLPWTHDAAVLIGRLVTHRGRLPQGAPTSPAIANLVFREYDVRIQELLGPAFVYTRYVDDLTISVSPRVAREVGIRTKADMKAYVESVLAAALSDSGFMLNPRKTKVTALSEGHQITGLAVSRTTIRLRRSTRRYLRTLAYRIEQLGLVEAASSWAGGEVHALTHWDGVHVQHRLERRRLSTERLAILMIKDLCTGLAIEVPSQTWDLGGTRVFREQELHEGKQALRDVSLFLPLLWENELRAEADDGHVNLKSHDGRIICRARCDRNVDFFLLGKRDAVASVELWHHLRGWSASLNPKSGERCFSSIIEAQMALRRVLDDIRVKVPSEATTTAARATGAASSLSLHRDVRRLTALADSVYKKYQQFAFDLTARHPSHNVLREAMDFQRGVTSIPTLAAWMSAARYMLVEVLPKLPATQKTNDKGFADVFAIIRVLDDQFKKLRNTDYELSSRFLKKVLRRGSIVELADGDAPTVQEQLLNLLIARFDESSQARQERGSAGWTGAQIQNDWFQARDCRLANLLNVRCTEFLFLHENAVWRTTGTSVFKSAAKREISDNLQALCEPIAAESSQDAWRKLFVFGKTLTAATTDSLEGDVRTLSAETVVRIKSRPDRSGREPNEKDLFEEFNTEVGECRATFDVLFLMRNRYAHPEDHKKVDEWNRIQRYAADALRRKRTAGASGHAEMLYTPDDLSLTSLEATELNVRCSRTCAMDCANWGSVINGSGGNTPTEENFHAERLFGAPERTGTDARVARSSFALLQSCRVR